MLDSVNPAKIAIYINSGKKTIAQVKAETGCTHIINGGLFDTTTFKAVCHLKSGDVVYSTADWARLGFGFNNGDKAFSWSTDMSARDNYIDCVELIKDGEIIPLTADSYPPDMAYSCDRSAVGFNDGTILMYCSQDNDTPESLQTKLYNLGWKNAIMLDGGGSSQGIFNDNVVESSRIVYDYICIWSDDAGKVKGSNNNLKKGIDVSEHQGVIDWEKVKGQIDFVMIRAGYGKNHIDRQFVHNISECNRLGIPIGAYWFSYATNADEAKAESEYCVAALSPYKVEYPVAFDFEYDSARYATSCGVTLTKELVSCMAIAFLLEIESAGHWAMNYSNPDCVNKYFSSDVTARFDFWLASWPTTPNFDSPPRSCGIWQWGGATYDGITGNVDSNVAYKAYVPETAPVVDESVAVPIAEPVATIDWKTEIADKALANSIITDELWKTKLDEPMPVWAVLKIALTLKGVQ